MPAVYNDAVVEDRHEVTITHAGATAVLEICSAAYAAVLVTFPLSNPIGVAALRVLTLSGFPETITTPEASGTAAVARIRTATAGTTILDGLTVGTTGTDIIVGSTTVSTVVPFALNSATITG
jgi:hypothetical protein